MKECKIIHIDGGSHRAPADRLAEDFVWAEKMLGLYLNIGYELLQLIPDYAVAAGHESAAVFRGGFTAVLVRERQPDEDTEEDVKDIYDFVDDMLAEFDTASNAEEGATAEKKPSRKYVPADYGVDSEEEVKELRQRLSADLEEFMDENGELPFH